VPSERLLRAGRVLRAVLQHESSHMIADRKHHLRVYRRAMVGADMVDWLVQRFPSLVRSRCQAVGVWQALLEEGVLVHGIVPTSGRTGFICVRYTQIVVVGRPYDFFCSNYDMIQ